MPDVHSCAHARTVPGDLDVFEALAGLEDRRGGLVGVAEDGHHPVAEPLDDLAAMRGHRRLDRSGDLAQQLERNVVTGLQRPVREADEVGEHDRQPIVAELAAGRRARPPPTPAGP